MKSIKSLIVIDLYVDIDLNVSNDIVNHDIVNQDIVNQDIVNQDYPNNYKLTKNKKSYGNINITKNKKSYGNINITNKNNIDLNQELNILKKQKYYIDTSDNHDNNCWCCTNYLIIHHKNIFEFISKYLIIPTKKSSATYPSSKLIKILYRLKPNLFINYDINKIKYLSLINKSLVCDEDSNMFKFQIYFSQPNLVYDQLINCTICKENYCPLHYSFNPFFNSKCNFCDGYWNICAWCKYDLMYLFFNINYTKLIEEEELCDIYHGSSILDI